LYISGAAPQQKAADLVQTRNEKVGPKGEVGRCGDVNSTQRA